MKNIKELNLYFESQLLLNKQKIAVIEQRIETIREFIELIDSIEKERTSGITP